MCDISTFEEQYQDNMDNIDINRLWYFVGIRNNIQVLNYLVSRGD